MSIKKPLYATSSLQDFAKSHFGITLTKYQIDLIEAWADGKTIVKARAMGKTTANKVARAYIKDSLETKK